MRTLEWELPDGSRFNYFVATIAWMDSREAGLFTIRTCRPNRLDEYPEPLCQQHQFGKVYQAPSFGVFQP